MIRSIRYSYLSILLFLFLGINSVINTNPSVWLSFLYQNKVGTLLRSFITKPWISTLSGWYADTWLSTFHIKNFIKKYDINMAEANRKNISEYTSFNDFFTRELHPQARPINPDPSAIISPADGDLHIFSNINDNTEIFVKEKAFDLATFLGNQNLAEQYTGGTIIIIYLSPRDYHRYHFPLNAIPSHAKQINGKYESVNPLVYQAHVQPLTENERQITLLKTKESGTIPFISVGALCVGRISQTYIPEKKYNKGDEMGYFSFGGSTVVVIFPKDYMTVNPTLQDQLLYGSVPIKMGQQIGHINTKHIPLHA